MNKYLNGKLVTGCSTPTDEAQYKLYHHLAEMYAPVVYFDPAERFYAVDVESYIAAAEMYVKQDNTEMPDLPPLVTKGQIVQNDLVAAPENSFVTVPGWKEDTKQLSDGSTRTFPFPAIEEMYNLYSSGQMNAKLTCYANICNLNETPNIHLFETYHPVNQQVHQAMREGLLISYYFFFPAHESEIWTSEGDWAGISILLPEKPSVEILDYNYASLKEPVLTCYFMKYSTGFFSPGTDGFQLWSAPKLKKITDVVSHLDTHPVVYISKGSHNCYYEPTQRTIPQNPPFLPNGDTDHIEDGAYYPAPIDHTMYGETDWFIGAPWYTYVIFPPLIIFELCGTACNMRRWAAYEPAPPPVPEEDKVDANGPAASPPKAASRDQNSSNQYPPNSNVPQLSMDVILVDHRNKLLDAIWRYQGSWGAATQLNGYGSFFSSERPIFASWFLWGLYWDPVYGVGATSYKPAP